MRFSLKMGGLLVAVALIVVSSPGMAKSNRGIGWIPEETRSGPMTLHSQRFWVEGRLFPNRETTFNVGWRWAVGDDEVGIQALYFDVQNKGTIAGDIRDSRMGDASLVWRHYFNSGSDVRWSIQAGVEINKWRGLNTRTQASASDDSPIWTLALPFGRENPQGSSWVIEPRLAHWKKNVAGSDGSNVKGFGNVFGVRFAGSSPISTRWWVVAEVIPLLSGSNSFNKDTGTLNRQVIFNVGLLTITKGQSWAKIGVTNGSGTTVATSMLAAPDVSAGFIIQAGSTF